MRRMRVNSALVVLTVLMMVAPGCWSNGRSLLPPKSRLIGQETLDRIEPGKTTADWVSAVLGPPSSVVELADSPGEIWKYRYKLVAGGSYRLHAGSTQSGSSRTIYIQFEQDVVTDSWMD